jgi:hypothetical protein
MAETLNNKAIAKILDDKAIANISEKYLIFRYFNTMYITEKTL